MDTATINNTFLCKHSMFGGLSDASLAIIRPYLEEHTYGENVTILKQGEPNNKVHFIVEGEVAVVRQSETTQKRGRIITTLRRGDSFGEMELIDIQNCAASVITLAPSHIITLSNKDLYNISLVDLKTYTMLILNLARDISRRLRGADEMLALVKNRATMPLHASQGDASL